MDFTLGLGAKLRLLRAKLEVNWSKLGRELGPCWPRLGQCCGHVGSKRCMWTILGRSAKCANYQSGALFGVLLCRKCPPPAEATSLRSVRSYPLLLSYHASAPSVRVDFFGGHFFKKPFFVKTSLCKGFRV